MKLYCKVVALALCLALLLLLYLFVGNSDEDEDEPPWRGAKGSPRATLAATSRRDTPDRRLSEPHFRPVPGAAEREAEEAAASVSKRQKLQQQPPLPCLQRKAGRRSAARGKFANERSSSKLSGTTHAPLFGELGCETQSCTSDAVLPTALLPALPDLRRRPG